MSEALPSNHNTQTQENDTAPDVANEVLDNTEVNKENAAKLSEALVCVYGSMQELCDVPKGQDTVLDKLRHDFPMEHSMALIQDAPEDINDEISVKQHNSDIRRRVVETMGLILELPAGMVLNYWRAAYSRLLTREDEGGEVPQYLEGQKVKKSLQTMHDIVQEVGVDRLRQINDKFEIVNLDRYRVEDIELLGKLIDKDEETLAYLRRGDVTAVLTDAYGDHNGAFNDTFLYFTQETHRTVPFEISRPSDLYRRMIALRDLGIKPSTVVVGVHGEPGGMYFGEEKIDPDKKDIYERGDGFAVISSDELADEYNGISLNASKLQLRRLTDEFMQDSKGRDDGREAARRRRLILLSCSSDVPHAENTKSLAEVIAEGSHRKVDVYGSADVLTYNLNEDGDVQFYKYEDMDTKASVSSANKITHKFFGGGVRRTEVPRVFRKTL